MGRLTHRVFHQAFTHWRKNIFEANEKQNLLSVQVEQDTQVNEADRIQKGRTDIAQKREKAEHKLEQLEKEQHYSKALIVNHIKRSINDHENNFIISKREHVF